ncbi:hypothetical protein GGR16_002601 [Chelatococcus caeni]|uniref:Late control protein n=1 Tax=Chelatococcus caeni TaxID=1348468 RepID=A0A840C588_9HYPH|nr:contractile injection system protein, VgrG/Pvc8 family [Chelatococcus caeni]MBB4017567.1 hypothetical protein [Chelatococcus caeni]
MPYVFSTTQRGFTPVLIVKVDGQEVSGGFYNRLIEASVRDEAGQKSDQATFKLDDAGNALELPREKASIELYAGWKETGPAQLIGLYELQTLSLAGDVSGGETMVLQASAADLRRKLKGEGREHFENTTVGKIVERIAGRNGLSARVSPELAGISIPYKARIDSSEIDFLTRLADDLGAVLKPMGNVIVMAPRGMAKSASGLLLPAIKIEKSDCSSWEVNPNGRAQYGKVRAAYIDQRTGKRVIVDAPTGLDGPDFTIRDPLPGREQAEKAAQAEARRLTRNTGDGHFELALGRVDAQAEADVIAGSSFRKEIAGVWRAEAVEHTWADEGWHTRIEIKAKEDGTSTKDDDDD